MNNAVPQPQTVVVLGGTSDIGQAIVAELVSPALRTVVLAVRHPPTSTPTRLAFGDAEIVVVPFDAAVLSTHDGVDRGHRRTRR